MLYNAYYTLCCVAYNYKYLITAWDFRRMSLCYLLLNLTAFFLIPTPWRVQATQYKQESDVAINCVTLASHLFDFIHLFCSGIVHGHLFLLLSLICRGQIKEIMKNALVKKLRRKVMLFNFLQLSNQYVKRNTQVIFYSLQWKTIEINIRTQIGHTFPFPSLYFKMKLRCEKIFHCTVNTERKRQTVGMI